MERPEEKLRSLCSENSLSIDEDKLAQTIAAAQAVCVMRKQTERRVTFTELVLWQVRFGNWKLWLGQLGILMLMGIVFFSIGSERGMTSWLERWGAYGLSCLTTFALSMTIPILRRSRRYKMEEVELATTFSKQGLVGAQLVWLIGSDVIFLALLAIMMVRRSTLSISSILWALVVPSLVLLAGYMLALVHDSGQRFEIIGGMMSVGMLGSLSGVKFYYPRFFVETFNVSWLLVCVCLGVVVVCQWRKLRKQSNRWL